MKKWLVFFSLIICIQGNVLAESKEDPSVKHELALAYTRLTGHFWQVWVKTLDGVPRQLTHSPSDKRNPRWSSDYGKILYRTGNREVFLLDLKTGVERQVLKKLGWIMDPDFFRNDSELIFTRFDSHLKDDSDIWVSDFEAKEAKILIKQPNLQYSPQISPDLSKVAYVLGKGFGMRGLQVFDLKGKSEINLTSGRFRVANPHWSPDGKLIAYASEENENYDIFVVDIKTRKTKQLTSWKGLDENPAWSPDGKMIAYTSDYSGYLQIWLISHDGSEPQKLLKDSIPAKESSWGYL